MAALPKKKISMPAGIPISDIVLHEGWCVKESGTAFLGKTNWRKRWFKLTLRNKSTILQYFRSRTDRTPAGSVRLNVTYCTRQLESHEKPHPNCFAVGPLVDDGAIRTYYISCPGQLEMQEWMTVIDAAIQGVPEQAQRRRQTISQKFNMRAQRTKSHNPPSGRGRRDSLDAMGESMDERALDLSMQAGNLAISEDSEMGATVDSSLEREDLSDEEVWESVEDEVSEDEEEGSGASALPRHRRTMSPDSTLNPASRLHLYDNQAWRMEQWRQLCHTAKSAKWSKIDTKEGITVARCKFGRGSRGHAVIKIEGVLPADPCTVYQFLQLSTREGGKLDYIFRNETLIQELETEPLGAVISNQFLLPLPRVSKRDIVAMKLWVPQYFSQDESSGFIMFSVDHPHAPPTDGDSRRINIDPSGCILSFHPGPDGLPHTHMTILIQVALYGALHRMLKGAYNSGLLKLGLRTTFTHIGEQLHRFVEVTDF